MNGTLDIFEFQKFCQLIYADVAIKSTMTALGKMVLGPIIASRLKGAVDKGEIKERLQTTV